MRNASGQRGKTSKVKMISSEKKSEQEHKQQNLWRAHTTTRHFISIKCVTRRCHVVVVQDNGKEIYKKVCSSCKVVFLLIIRLLIFFACSRCRHRLALLDFIFCLSKL